MKDNFKEDFKAKEEKPDGKAKVQIRGGK